MSNVLRWVWLSEKCNKGSSEMLTLIEKFGSIDAIFEADYDQYCEKGISERLAEDLCDKGIDRAQKIIGYCQRADVGILTYDAYDYPITLRALKNPPAVLYYIGTLPDFNRSLCISVVGTRKMSEYGMKAAYKIAYEVASAGAIVVSGMALGIDGVASCAAIAAKGRTVAVLGCGIDIVYPKEHKKLKEIIRQNGAVVTEFPPATEPRGMNFPIRNRIISGLSQGTVVVDADLSSGAMITAKNAILQGRDLFAVPGNIDTENASGTNSLIRDGAQAVLCGTDIIRNYMYLYRERLDTQRLNNSVKHSDFNPDAVKNMGIAVRAAKSLISQERIGDGEHKKTVGQERSAKPSWQSEKEAKPKDGERIERKETMQGADTPSRVDNDRVEESSKKSGGDDSARILEKLSEKQRRVFDEMPLDRAVTVDYLTKTGFALGEVISALTVLEIKGLVSSLPGALYIRK